MVISQGDVVWVDLPPPRGSAPAGRRPALVLQHDRFNRTKLNTIVVAAITSNLKYAALPGNVRLRRGEAGLPRASVVNVTQIATVDRGQIGARLGEVAPARLREVWDGVMLVLAPEAMGALAPGVGRAGVARAGRVGHYLAREPRLREAT
jgi:mRNA interferase MazF